MASSQRSTAAAGIPIRARPSAVHEGDPRGKVKNDRGEMAGPSAD
jgi:hypothetical protein